MDRARWETKSYLALVQVVHAQEGMTCRILGRHPMAVEEIL